MLTEFSHQELSLLLFSLDGGAQPAPEYREAPSCEDSCPVVENIEDLLGSDNLTHDKKLARHLSNHLREGLIECGMFELMATNDRDQGHALSSEDQMKLHQANQRLKNWRCEIKLDSQDRQLLRDALSRLPRSAWFAMPAALWRLRKKLKNS